MADKQGEFQKELLIDGNELQLIDYSEKSFVISGRTFAWIEDIKAEFKYISFNKYLKFDGNIVKGWIIPKSKNAEDVITAFVEEVNSGEKGTREETEPSKPKGKKIAPNAGTQNITYNVSLPSKGQKVQLKANGLLVDEYTVYSLDNQGKFVDNITLIDSDDVFYQAAVVAGEWQVLNHEEAHELIFT
jgi:hypothetical protein